MLTFPNCKINLGLHITSKRNDGYHNLETLFVPIKWYDVLEIIHTPENNTKKKLTSTGIIATTNDDDNICLKAYSILKADFPTQLPAVQFYLHKTIPAGAGLGGGSADGAFTLTLLNRQFNLGLSTKQLLDYAGRLGSDCPFFTINKPCFATGRGEILEPVHLDLAAYKFLLVNPRLHITTKEAFEKLTPAMPPKSIKEIIAQPITTWKDELKNDFEKPVFKNHPAIEMIKKTLYQAGAVYAAMSGSGSTVFGIFNKKEMPSLNFPAEYLINQSNG